jgi:hypothetical protein
VTALESNNEAARLGCDTKRYDLEAKSFTVVYPDDTEITVVASKSLENCLKKGIRLSQRQRSAVQKIWEEEAEATELSLAPSGGGHVEEEVD